MGPHEAQYLSTLVGVYFEKLYWIPFFKLMRETGRYGTEVYLEREFSIQNGLLTQREKVLPLQHRPYLTPPMRPCMSLNEPR
jgi:hypothetical protein